MHVVVIALLVVLGILAAGWALHLGGGARWSRRPQAGSEASVMPATPLPLGERVRLDCFVTSHLRTLEP